MDSERWPYEIAYDRTVETSVDVLIVGGGIAGCHAAVSAARRGASVAVVDKGAVVRSGSGGPGVDHWHGACTNPCSKVSPEELVELVGHCDFGVTAEYGNGITCYIMAKESYDALLDMEDMGGKIRDVDDEFVGAEFRDEETKLMFAYDYENKHCLRVHGWEFKPLLHRRLKRLGAQVFDRVMITTLLTEEGKQGGRVVGATGFNVRTGAFHVFRAKATVLTTGQPLRLWNFLTEIQGSSGVHDALACAGDGCAMAWNAGAELALMEKSAPHAGSFNHVAYGSGNAHNTWYACSIVDVNGKEVPWVDRDGKALETVSERYRPAPGQKYFLLMPDLPYEYRGPSLIPDLPDRIKSGEFKLPLYADLPAMPAHERRAIFGLMVGNEGLTRIPVYANYTAAGFDPDVDMLQATVQSPDAYVFKPWWQATAVPQLRETGRLVDGGGLLFDWDLKTSLDGLYAAGNQLCGGADHAASATTGRYAGRKAADHARVAVEVKIAQEQVDSERDRVYAPVRREGGIGWKELQSGLCRVMQDYCGEYKSAETLKTGLEWLASIRDSEAEKTYARNPHELMRALEAMVRLTVGEIIMNASLAREASSRALGFDRIDYPEVDPPDWNKLVSVRLQDGEPLVRTIPCDYHLAAPNHPTYEENYREHSALDEGQVR